MKGLEGLKMLETVDKVRCPAERLDLECAGFTFLSNFDSGNLGLVELVEKSPSDANYDDTPDYEFNIWTRPDCAGTEYENGNRTWFYFGVKGGHPYTLLKFNMMNLNKQSKIYSQGMSPVFKVVPGRQRWERIKDKPSFFVENHQFVLSFKFRLQDSYKTTVYFAFTYPFTYSEQQLYLNSLQVLNKIKANPSESDAVIKICSSGSRYRYKKLRQLSIREILGVKCDDIYYHRELLCYSYENRRVDLLTISSYHNITSTREPMLPNLFPDPSTPRPYKFENKKVIMLSGRVHPGETPSSHVLVGMLNMLLNKSDSIGSVLRRNFVFKIIPMLNPDGVFQGNYRTDTRGVNLNRVYNNPSPTLHSPIYGARSVLLYAHCGEDALCEEGGDVHPQQNSKVSHIEDKVSVLTLYNHLANQLKSDLQSNGGDVESENDKKENLSKILKEDSNLFLYIDMHGHASKKGIFMYGNHFETTEENVECMLLPKLVSINSQHFHFESCNFSEKNMYVRDKRDGSSREGSGRVSVLKSTGLVRSYTLECNYNTGKVLNPLPPPVRIDLDKRPVPTLFSPPKYTPQIYEEVGRAILASILDMVGLHPNSRLCNSSHRSVANVREALKLRIMQESPKRKRAPAPQSACCPNASSPVLTQPLQGLISRYRRMKRKTRSRKH